MIQIQNQHRIVSAVMWRPYIVSELSISYKVFGGCTFISFRLLSDIYVQRMVIRGSITAHIDFHTFTTCTIYKKTLYCKFQQNASIYAVIWRPYLVSELSISFKVFAGCTFISCRLVPDIYVHRMAIREI